MTYVETRVSVWEALAGRPAGKPLHDGDPAVWTAVDEHLDPARATPVLRDDIECAPLTSARGVDYVMLRSPDAGAEARYLRLSPQEWQLAQLMDGSLTVARLVAEFARIAGRLAPGQVRRVVADLAANRMLAEPAVDAYPPPDDDRRRPWPARLGGALLAVARGRRMPAVDVDPLFSRLYRAGGRLLFTRTAAVVGGAVALAGLAVFVLTWLNGSQSIFLTGTSYVLGAVVLLLLNVVALACHEFGHGLATKHAGRRVPAAGVLLYFGIPSVFVDTSDAWMAGRRARLRVTAAGPLAGLVLAGAMQLIGLAVPALAPLAFKLAFLWYLNTLVNLNPFIALDGYYLLIDWLEIPNLRGRALSWVAARLRRRPPAFGALDGEGRLVALYGVVAVLWLAVAVNVAYRIWSDRVAGLITGLWHAGPGSKLLLLLVIAALLSPVLFLAAGRIVRRWRRHRMVVAERRREEDQPRRLEALRRSEFGRLPLPALTSLANRARWIRPASGTQLVIAGSAQSAVYVVVDGAMQGRLPGDPGGGIRHRVGPGGIVGLANALNGRPAALDWHTAGTTLLSLPPAVVSTVVGPMPGPPPADRAEAEALLDETPAFVGVGPDDRVGLIASALPLDLAPGAPVVLPGPTHAVIVESGVIAMPDGTELRRGTLIGPVGEGNPGAVAQTRTPTRLWVLPDASGVSSIVGGTGHGGETAVLVGAAPVAGVHGGGGYPPVSPPPGPPPSGQDTAADARFEKRMLWLVLLLAFLAVSLTVSHLFPGPAWAEMPADRVLLTAERGGLTAVTDGRAVRLDAGDRRYVGERTVVQAGPGSAGRLTFTGGAAALLCAGSVVGVGPLATSDGTPAATLALTGGRLLADTAATSAAYEPLALVVQRAAGEVRTAGAAWFAADAAAVQVATGTVTAAGTSVPATGGTLTCGDGVPVTPPAGTPSESPSAVPTGPASAEPSPSASVSASPSPSASVSVSPGPVSASPSRLPESTPTARPPAPVSPRPSVSSAPPSSAPPSDPPESSAPPSPTPGDSEPPVIGSAGVTPTLLFQAVGCDRTATVTADVAGAAAVDVAWTVFDAGTGAGSGSAGMRAGTGTLYSATVGPFGSGGPALRVELVVTAVDQAKNVARRAAPAITVADTCAGAE